MHLSKNDEEYVYHKGKKGQPDSFGTAGQDAIECVEKVTSLLQSMKFQKHAQVGFEILNDKSSYLDRVMNHNLWLSILKYKLTQ